MSGVPIPSLTVSQNPSSGITGPVSTGDVVFGNKGADGSFPSDKIPTILWVGLAVFAVGAVVYYRRKKG